VLVNVRCREYVESSTASAHSPTPSAVSAPTPASSRMPSKRVGRWERRWVSVRGSEVGLGRVNLSIPNPVVKLSIHILCIFSRSLKYSHRVFVLEYVYVVHYAKEYENTGSL
jgi:hypothetical protein